MRIIPTATISDAVASRVHELDWSALTAELDEHGFAITDRIYAPDESRDLAGLFDGGGFRSTIDMARHRFGDGRYRYFDHPLPDEIQGARTAFYEHLAPVANAWGERLSGEQPTFPDTHEELLERCRFVIFPTRERPHAGARGYHRVGLRHGVSTLTSGQRTALGIIFHDAR
jgi:hypothetical protein